LQIDENTKSNGEKSSEAENLPIDASKQKFMQVSKYVHIFKGELNGNPETKHCQSIKEY